MGVDTGENSPQKGSKNFGNLRRTTFVFVIIAIILIILNFRYDNFLSITANLVTVMTGVMGVWLLFDEKLLKWVVSKIEIAWEWVKHERRQREANQKTKSKRSRQHRREFRFSKFPKLRSKADSAGKKQEKPSYSRPVEPTNKTAEVSDAGTVLTAPAATLDQSKNYKNFEEKPRLQSSLDKEKVDNSKSDKKLLGVVIFVFVLIEVFAVYAYFYKMKTIEHARGEFEEQDNEKLTLSNDQSQDDDEPELFLKPPLAVFAAPVGANCIDITRQYNNGDGSRWRELAEYNGFKILGSGSAMKCDIREGQLIQIPPVWEAP